MTIPSFQLTAALQDNNIEMYSIHKEGKSVVDERFIRTLKNKIYKYMTSISKIVYIDQLDGIINKHNNTYNKTIKMKSVDVKSSTYIEFNKVSNKKVLNLKLVIMLEYHNIKIFLQKFRLQIDQKKIL